MILIGPVSSWPPAYGDSATPTGYRLPITAHYSRLSIAVALPLSRWCGYCVVVWWWWWRVVVVVRYCLSGLQRGCLITRPLGPGRCCRCEIRAQCCNREGISIFKRRPVLNHFLIEIHLYVNAQFQDPFYMLRLHLSHISYI